MSARTDHHDDHDPGVPSDFHLTRLPVRTASRQWALETARLPTYVRTSVTAAAPAYVSAVIDLGAGRVREMLVTAGPPSTAHLVSLVSRVQLAGRWPARLYADYGHHSGELAHRLRALNVTLAGPPSRYPEFRGAAERVFRTLLGRTAARVTWVDGIAAAPEAASERGGPGHDAEAADRAASSAESEACDG